ncbi:DNA-directed RNA polymerase, mitochondrial isoform X2 [Phyllopteryx taeniolatus]|uniref:DNA-directed RNA polymerase, mitochondrial isoform X2 n=1 Tax=Phyllopteryx taeniolatus TaxID=161469 RepID=UPI002AD366E7|nr:DNA-directed RNA polymerase, mitochondrial isoform X2 [Phyllopteryx taeniolatus]
MRLFHVNMSLLRVCAFVKCLHRRSLLEKCASRAPLAECCQRCLAVRNGADTHLQPHRRNVSFSVRKTEDPKKRVVEQTQLLDVLEARIQQLQPESLLDVQKANVEFLQAPSSGSHISSVKTPNTPPERPDVSKSAQNVVREPSKSQPTRWMEKLTKEKKSKMKKRQHLREKLQKNVKEKVAGKHPGGKGNPKLPGTSYKTISSKNPAGLAEKSNVNANVQAASQKAPKSKRKNPKNKPPSAKNQVTDEELAQVEELERRLSQQASPWSCLSQPEHPLQATEGAVGNTRSCIFSWLEACVFAGDIERAHSFLLSQHRVRSRRAVLDTDVYNIMLRVWAKKGTLNQIGRLFILLEEASLRPNIGSYCAALECMGRNAYCSPQVINRCLNQMEEDGFSVDDVFSQCVFQLDEREMALKAVRIIHPDYQPASNHTTSQSPSSLVQDLYTKRDNHQYPKLDFTRDELQERFKFQLDMEHACAVTIDSVEAEKPITEHMAKMRALLLEQRAHWRRALLQAFREGKMILGKTNTKDFRLNLYPYFCLLEDNDYVDIMIQSVSSMPPSGESLMTLAKDVGSRIYTKYSVQQKYRNHMVEKLGSIYNAYTDLLAKDTKAYNVLPREEWCKLETAHPSGPTLQGCESSWPYIVTLELGTYLLDLMVKNLKINSDILNSSYDRKRIPILYHMYTFRSNRQVGFIKPHPILTQMQQEAMETKLTFDSSVMPMRCPPLPWTSVKFGAYLLTPAKLMRSVDGVTQHEELLERCQNLHPVLDSLNQLGNCAWRINKPLLDVIISIFNDRGSDKLDIPPPVSEAPKIPFFNPQDPSYTSTEKAHMKREVINARKKCSEMHSLRMDALYKLSIANHIRDEVFWFPHNMDFRGRTYPCPPYFNHLGSDVTRSILLFAEGKPLGPKGLNWLKIHLVNLTGLKKRSSLQGRLEYADSIMEDILDSADHPLNGKKWWMNADEPWQALACCMEIANAVRSHDPTQFISHFPVHQDGSCNGLQHYAALGRDVIGATSVNLMSCDVPQDVYSGVAQQVEEFRARDAKSGLKIAQVLEGFINRKVVKQTVMTVVYGVTRYGGRLQIEKRLKEIDEFPKEYVWEASHYLVRQVFSGLKEMFTGTREIQDWLTESARLISKAGHTVQWLTPLGLPIIQPYHRIRHHLLRSPIQYLNLQISHDTKQRPDTVKQKNAFPPNFIHSLDSTHMMLTALHCQSFGLTFVSVHDCFWTHALTVDTMNKVIREQFVALHNQPILQELSDFLLHKYCSRLTADSKNKKYLEDRRLMLLLAKVPQTGTFDLSQVKKSIYFFS